ncbi:MAG: hypothetical protein QM756_18855 [Polyangiaceae bacterium]
MWWRALQPSPKSNLSPVAAPDDLIAVGRLARPRALFETLANWCGFPVHVSDLLPSEVRVLNDVVAWDAPVEVAAVLDRHSSEKVPPPEYVVSVGLTSLTKVLSAAKDKGFEATRVSSSVYRVPLSDEVFCAVAAAAGAAPVRLVCSASWQNVEDLLPYATRGLPREDFAGQDLYLALRPAPLQRRYGQEIGALPLFVGIGLRQIQSDSPRLDRALADAAYGLAGELKTLAMQLDGFESPRASTTLARRSTSVTRSASPRTSPSSRSYFRTRASAPRFQPKASGTCRSPRTKGSGPSAWTASAWRR